MSQLKHKRITRSTLAPKTVVADAPQTRQKQPAKVTQKAPQKTLGEKKKIPQRSLFQMGFKKSEKQAIEQPKMYLYSMKELLKDISIQTILEKCPKIKIFYDRLCEHPCANNKIVLQCLDKYFHGSSNSNWEQKYAPRCLDQLFQIDFGRKIQEWIKDFYYYRKSYQENDSQFSFIDDMEDEYSKSMQVRMQNYGWSCRGLILKGRSGVGKYALLNAIAKSMKFSIFEFSSENDQLQKLKQQLKGSSESECVDSIINKKQSQQNNKIRRQNISIVNFINAQQQQQQQQHQIQSKKPKRLQIFRDFTLYYPNDEKIDKINIQESFIRYLLDSVEKSRVPFVLTTSKYKYSVKQSTQDKINKLDTVQFMQSTIEQLSTLFWTILQIETNLHYNSFSKISGADLYTKINDEENQQFWDKLIKNSNSDYLESYAFINELIIRSNKKISYIYKYLQYNVCTILKSKNNIKKQVVKNPDQKIMTLQEIQSDQKTQKKTQFTKNQQKMQCNSYNQNQKSNGIICPLDNKQTANLQAQIQKQYAQQIFKQISKELFKRIDSERLVYDIDWQIVQSKNIQYNPLELTADVSEKSSDDCEKYLIDQKEKEQKQKEVEQIMENNTKNTNRALLKNTRLNLEIGITEDCKGFQKLKNQLNNQQISYFKDENDLTSPYQTIPFQIHVQAKKQIVKSIQDKWIENGKSPLNLRAKNLYLLPMLFKQKRSHRVLRKCNNESLNENFQKIMNAQQLKYLKKFCKFVTQDS